MDQGKKSFEYGIWTVNIRNISWVFFPVIMGDFNIHINSPDDTFSQLFMDSMLSFGLDQPVAFPTQRHGNMLDLVFTETNSPLHITKCETGRFISDHCSVNIVTSLLKENITRKSISYRKLNDINMSAFEHDIRSSSLGNPGDSLESLVSKLEDQLRTVLDAHTPLKTREITIRTKYLWFNDNIKQQKGVVHKKERT